MFISVLSRVNNNISGVGGTAASTATVRPSRHLRGDVPRDPADSDPGAHGFLYPLHRLRPFVLHSIVKSAFSNGIYEIIYLCVVLLRYLCSL